MEKRSSSSINISLDSLEADYKRRNSLKDKVSDENVDTILVPFYEKDVLIKVPKGKKKQKKVNEKNSKNNDTQNKHQPRNYLVNKDSQYGKKTSYLEMFRKQFFQSPPCNEVPIKTSNTEIRSISPQFGDSTNESIGGESNNVNDFFNTESYNEIYYEKLMTGELERYLDLSFEQALHFNEDETKPDDMNENNLRSVSQVSQPRRNVRRITIPPTQNIRLGGLGPDMENIKPRLERARSLQRYSEQVRMENRVKIYKKGLETKNETNEKRNDSSRKKLKDNNDNKNNSYLMNKNVKDSPSIKKKVCNAKSYSADVYKKREIVHNENVKNSDIDENQNHRYSSRIKDRIKVLSAKATSIRDNFDNRNLRVKSSSKTREVNIGTKQGDPPVQINCLVNVGEVRPSSALKSLEEKHRLYQEKVKSFTMANNH